MVSSVCLLYTSIFIDGYDKNNYQFIEDKELFVEIGLELNRISNKYNFSKISNSSLLNYKLEREEFYNPNELKRILSNNKKVSIIPCLLYTSRCV